MRRGGDDSSTGFPAVSLATVDRWTELAARNQVISDVDEAWVGYMEAKGLSDRFSGHSLDESRDVLSMAQYAFQHGGLALIDHLDALRDARSSTSDALNAFSNTWNAIHQLSAGDRGRAVGPTPRPPPLSPG